MYAPHEEWNTKQIVYVRDENGHVVPVVAGMPFRSTLPHTPAEGDAGPFGNPLASLSPASRFASDAHQPAAHDESEEVEEVEEEEEVFTRVVMEEQPPAAAEEAARRSIVTIVLSTAADDSDAENLEEEEEEEELEWSQAQHHGARVSPFASPLPHIPRAQPCDLGRVWRIPARAVDDDTLVYDGRMEQSLAMESISSSVVVYGQAQYY